MFIFTLEINLILVMIYLFIRRSTNDDVDVLKRELVSVQHRMNEISLEKEKQIEKLRFILTETYEYILKFDHLESVFNQVTHLFLF